MRNQKVEERCRKYLAAVSRKLITRLAHILRLVAAADVRFAKWILHELPHAIVLRSRLRSLRLHQSFVLAGCSSTSESVTQQPTDSATTTQKLTLSDGTVITAAPGTTLQLDELGNASGRNGQEEILIHGTGTHVDNIVARIYQGNTFNGHHHIYTNTGSIKANQANHSPIVTYTVGVGAKMTNKTQVCAEAWRENGGGNYTLMGRPCLIVEN